MKTGISNYYNSDDLSIADSFEMGQGPKGAIHLICLSEKNVN